MQNSLLKFNNGIAISIYQARMTAYRLKKEWQEDPVMFLDYSYGDLFSFIV